MSSVCAEFTEIKVQPSKSQYGGPITFYMCKDQTRMALGSGEHWLFQHQIKLTIWSMKETKHQNASTSLSMT